MDYLTFGFFSSTVILFIGSIIVNFFEKDVPLLARIFKYGKIGVEDNNSFFNKIIIDVPKSFFKHFYCLAVITFSYALYQATSVYIFENDVSRTFKDFLDAATETERTSEISVTHVYLSLCLMTMHVYRRFYETHFISVFSKNSKMNILLYILALLYYSGVPIAIMCEAPQFAPNSKYPNNRLTLSDLSVIDYSSIVLFIWAWWHQHKSFVILANLRKNKKGEVVTSEHKLPFGDWFEYVSSPPQIAEILMYTAISIILRNHTTWLYVYAFVVVNQIETILLSHWWYISAFKNFPKNRKALIPFVY